MCIYIFGCVPLFMFAAVQRACRPYPPSVTWGGVIPSDRDPPTVRETRYQRIAIRSTLFWCFLALCQQQYHYYVNANWSENCRPMKNVKFYLCLIEDDAMKAYGGMETLLHSPTTGTKKSGQLRAWPLCCLRWSLKFITVEKVWPQFRPGHFGQQKNLLPCW